MDTERCSRSIPCLLNGHHVQTTSVGLDVGDWTLTYGPGHLLLRLILSEWE